MKILNRFTGKLILEIETTLRANLLGANLQGADLQGANLQGANLLGANLQGANLLGANLLGADLDFSCFPLWCGSFSMKIDTRLVWQLIAHLKRCDTSDVSKKAKKALEALEPYKNEFCRYRNDVKQI